MSGIGNVPQLADRNHRLFLQALKERVVKLQTQAGGTASSESTAAIQQQVNALRDRIVEIERELEELDSGGGSAPAPSGDDVSRANAGAALGAHRAIYVDGGVANYADASNSTAQRVAGITISAASAGAAISYRTAGEIVEPSWSWANGAIYLGANGLLTQTPPSSGTAIELAVATSPTKIIVRIGLPILLQ